jgi:hypothetical protein
MNAASAFESTFPSAEPIVMLFRTWTDKRQRIRPTAYWLRCVSESSRQSLRLRKRRTEQRGLWIREAMLTGSSDDFEFRHLFQAIAHGDFSIAPNVRGSIYLLSLHRNIVFHMYDDRGLLIAVESESELPELQPQLLTKVIAVLNEPSDGPLF